MPKPRKNTKPLLLSLFCGAGGMDVGFEKNGFDVGLAFDIRPDSVESYNKNRKKKVAVVRDITTLTVDELDKLYGRKFAPIGIIGGPPCQGFSQSNVNKKKSDPRNKLSLTYASLLKELNERSPVHFFVFENVKGLLSERHKSTYQKIKSTFRNCGYSLHIMTLNAVDFKVPQLRERLIIVGLNRKIYEVKTWQPPEPSRTERDALTIKKFLKGLPEPAFYSPALKPSCIPYHPNHWCMAPKSSKFTKGILTQGISFGRSFRTLKWEKPSPTVAYGNREVHVHPSGKRRLSVHEAMILQGFPKTYVLKGNLSQQIKQVSEAVPPPLAKAVAKAIMVQLKLGKQMLESDL